jgi:hypothetical protein
MTFIASRAWASDTPGRSRAIAWLPEGVAKLRSHDALR